MTDFTCTLLQMFSLSQESCKMYPFWSDSEFHFGGTFLVTGCFDALYRSDGSWMLYKQRLFTSCIYKSLICVVWTCVHLSVCLSQAGIVWKRLKRSSSILASSVILYTVIVQLCVQHYWHVAPLRASLSVTAETYFRILKN